VDISDIKKLYVDFEYCTYITTMNIIDKMHKINVTDIIGTLCIIAHSMNKLNITGNSRNNIRVNSVRKSYIMIQMQTFCLFLL
jgi:hypothetical protein